MINAAIYGLGRWGRTLVESVQGKSEAIRFVKGVARTPANHADFGDAMGFQVVGDYAAVLADPSVDAVVLATPNGRHAEQVIQAAKAGKHVQVEKPFTLSRSSAEAAAAACEAAGVTLAVAFNRRFRPAHIAMKGMLADGRIGQPLHVEANFSGPTFLRTPAESWRAKKADNPAGGLSPRGIHTLDFLIDAFGPVSAVCALSERRFVALEVDDVTAMLLRFESGMTGYLACVMATGECWRIHAMGSEGWIEMRTEHRLVVSDLDKIVEERDFEPLDIERAELEAFARVCEGGDDPWPVTPAQAIHGAAVHEAIANSAAKGHWVRVG